MARMRTIKEAYEHIKREDPESALTMYALRGMVKMGEVPSITVGKKFLLNLDALESVLSTERNKMPPLTEGIIRPVAMR